MLTLHLRLAWPDRVVHVHVRAVPLVRSGRQSYRAEADPVPLGPDDVVSMAGFRAFLTRASRLAVDGDSVRAVGLQPDVIAVLDLLQVTAPLPETIEIDMGAP